MKGIFNVSQHTLTLIRTTWSSCKNRSPSAESHRAPIFLEHYITYCYLLRGQRAGFGRVAEESMRIGTATCRAWSKRVSVTRPPQSPCNAQACHYHATLSTMGSIRARTQPRNIERVCVAFPLDRMKCTCVPSLPRSRFVKNKHEGCVKEEPWNVAARHTYLIVSFEVALASRSR